MILTNEELKVLVHHYNVKAACAEAQGLDGDAKIQRKCVDQLKKIHSYDLQNIREYKELNEMYSLMTLL